MEAKKILLVEDDPNFGAVLKDYLMINDFDVTLAKNGMEGFEKFKKDTFDLCILDVMMPYKDGYTLAREIREKNQEVPIIFLTAKTLKEDVLKGYKVGADDYLNKPFDSEVLLMKIKAIIQRKALEVKPDTTKFEFEIGKFHLNSKLRFLTFPGQEPIKLSPKECELLKMLALHENDLRRCGLRQDRSGDPSGVQGRDRRQAGGRAGAYDDSGPATLPLLRTSAPGFSREGRISQPDQVFERDVPHPI